MLYSSAAPSYDIKGKEEEWDESIDANNPDNYNTSNDPDEEDFI